MSEFLWDDDRIFGELKQLGAYSGPTIPVETAELLAFMMRDEMNARIAELKSDYKGLAELNKRNCNDALRIKGASDAALALVFLTFDNLKAKDARIAELQSQLDAARAGSYVPLPNGVYHTDGPEAVEVADERIIVYQGAQGAWANLQQGFALCKLQPFGVSPPLSTYLSASVRGETPKPASD